MSPLKNKIVDIEEKPETDRFVCKILDYKIYATKDQYTVRDFSEGQKKVGRFMGFHRKLVDALEEILEDGERRSTLDSKTIEKVIENIIEFNKKFYKLMEPLRKLEEFIIK